MTRPAKILIVLLSTAVGVPAVAAHAESDQIPKRVSVGHVQVGGLAPKAALIRLQRRIGAPARRPVSVRAAGRRFTLTAARTGVAVDLRAPLGGRSPAAVTRTLRSVAGGI